MLTEDEIYRNKLTTMVADFVHENPGRLHLCFHEAVLFQTACMAELFKLRPVPVDLITALESSIRAMGLVEVRAMEAFPGESVRSVG